jgi:tetratricopeptide (TPR) repeat protein
MVFKWKQYTVTIIVITLMTMYCKLAAQTSPKNFKDANELILAGSIQATSVNKREFIEKQSNDAVTASTFHSALSHWKKELAKDSTNANLNYKTGLCYFFSYDQQLKAMPYFKKAIKGLTDTYDFNNQKETKAPYSAYYFLADTYLENNQPDSAIKYFSMYQDNYQTIPISAERGVFMSINAKESEKHPRNVNVATLGNAINTSFAETNPVMKLDNKLLFFSSRRPNNQQTDTTGDQVYDADIYFATKNENNKWSNVSPFTYNTEFDEAPLYLSPNGDVLYFRKTIKNNTDIFKTELVNNVWTKPQPVNEINTPFNETGVSISGDGKYLYFCSDQNKVAGMYDIFKCTKQANGKWGKLEILSTTINTPFNEVSPYVSPDGKTLFFSSNGSSKKGIGSYDIYYSELKSDSTWTEPNNLGYPINKCRADINYYVAGDDKRYFSSLTENNSYDIFIVEGGGFDFENIAAGTEVVTVTNEMGVTQVMETEKQVEKEVEVTQAVETIVEKEKEVEVIKTVEVEKTSDPITSTDSNTKTETGEKKNELIIDGTILNTENTNDFVRDVKVFLLDHEGKRIQATKTNDKGYFAFEELDPEKTYMAEVETTEDNLKNKARYYLADKNGKITRMTHDNGGNAKICVQKSIG